MDCLRPLPALAAIAAAALLLVPERTLAFSTNGGRLDLDQRDVRVFNNFSDPFSNDNTTPHPSFPGYVGAELAIWKATVEWGSGPHGDGSGDPHPSNAVLGDGGANFDPSWQGNADGVGGTDDNVVSAISSCGGGVGAFTELPVSDGWRIRFCDDLVWDDGPDTNIIGADLQGVATHEYGHALGLGHSTVTPSTMRAGGGSGLSARSIAPDDQSGIRFVYGVAAAAKPRIDAITGGFALSITGAHFAPLDNEVWFTQEATGGTGQPVKLSGVPSASGGTLIQVVAPAAAGRGDVLVRVPGGGTGEFLSNAYPHDPELPEPVTYCTGKTTSAGCLPFLSTAGTASVTSGPFDLIAENHVEGRIATLIYGTKKSSLAFHGGTLCVKIPFTRVGTLVKSTDGTPCSGCAQPTCRSLQRNFNQLVRSGQDPSLTIGLRVNAQFRQRDPGDPAGFGDNLSDAVSFVIGP